MKEEGRRDSAESCYIRGGRRGGQRELKTKGVVRSGRKYGRPLQIETDPCPTASKEIIRMTLNLVNDLNKRGNKLSPSTSRMANALILAW